jgi:hypothetical protein
LAQLGRGVDGLIGDPDHPPLIGGRKAISSSGEIGTEPRTKV